MAYLSAGSGVNITQNVGQNVGQNAGQNVQNAGQNVQNLGVQNVGVQNVGQNVQNVGVQNVGVQNVGVVGNGQQPLQYVLMEEQPGSSRDNAGNLVFHTVSFTTADNGKDHALTLCSLQCCVHLY